MSERDPVRVLIVAPSFGAYGGIEAFVFAVATSLAGDRRFEVRLCFKRVTNFHLQPALERCCGAEGAEFCDRASPRLWSSIAWADVVHGQNASSDVALMCAVLRKPLALTIHDFLPDKPFARRVSWQLAAWAASTRWYNSKAVWRTWEPRRCRPTSSKVPTISQLPSGEVAPAARRGFLFVGRLVGSKGVEVLLDAYATSGLDATDWPLTIVGDGPLRAALEARCAADVRLHGVTFHGFVEDRAKAALISSAKWLVTPSHDHEGLGLVVLEARHVGVPCIITRHGGLPEAGGRDSLTCSPNDVHDLAEALGTAARMSHGEYQRRATRTKQDLTRELVPLSFYPDAYLRLARARDGL